MSQIAPPVAQPPQRSQLDEDAPYQDLLGLWSDLEAGLSLLLAHPPLVQQFPQKVQQLEQWLQELVAHDSDSALFLMFQLAGSSTVGYSASHALVCATLCHILAFDFKLPVVERSALVRSAFTMNIGMTALQDQLALQKERPSVAQQEAIRQHPAEGSRLLAELGVNDKLWRDVVALHHINADARLPLMEQTPSERLARILATTDRYAAMISPRRNRAGRSVADSVQAVTGPQSKLYIQAGDALIRSVGLFPPGVFVALSSKETAVVLRRTSDSNHPVVAKLLDERKLPLRQPELVQTNAQTLRISHALPSAEVNLHVDHRTMVRLGMYAAQFSSKFHQLVQVPGTK